MIAERRAVDVKDTQKVRRVNWMLVVLCVCLGAVLVTLAVVAWDVNQRANDRAESSEQNQFLLCVILAAHNVTEIGPQKKVCDKFDWWIEHQTNARASQ